MEFPIRYVRAVGIVLLLTCISCQVWMMPSSTSAEATPPAASRVLEIHASSGDVPTDQVSGCRLYKDLMTSWYLPRQVIVENEDHQVIAVASLDNGTIQHNQNGRDSCVVNTKISLPEARFYRILLDYQLITVVSASTWPAGGTLTIPLSLDR